MADVSTQGTELVLTAPEEKPSKRSKPSLVKVGNRYLSEDGRFHPSLALEFLRSHRLRWVGVAELARMFYGSAIPGNKQRVRKRLPDLFAKCVMVGELLVIEVTADTGRASAVKLFDPRSEMDRQTIRPRLERLKKRKEITSDLFARACAILAEFEGAAEIMGTS